MENAKLLEHPEIIELRPRLDDLAASNVVNGDPRKGGGLIGGWHTKQTAGVCTLRCPVGHYCVLLRHLFHNGCL